MCYVYLNRIIKECIMRTKLLAVTLIFVFVFNLSVVYGETNIRYGDINGDSTINAQDSLIILQAAAKIITLSEQQLKAANVKNSGEINAKDALYILQKAAHLIEKFPVESGPEDVKPDNDKLYTEHKVSLGRDKYAKVVGYYDQDLALEFVELINKYRAEHGLGKLTVNNDLTESAMVRAKEIAYSFSHTRPNGERFNTAIKGGFRSMRENLAAGYLTADEILQGWKDSEGHNLNMLADDCSYIGVSVFVEKRQFENGEYYDYYWWTLHLGGKR